MAKWNCYTGNGDFAGVVEAASEDDAIKCAVEEFDVKIARVELRSVLSESEKHGKG